MTIEELTALSDEELRVKVAEKMGWELFHGQSWYPPRGPMSDPDGPPPFSTSLDAIHEAEKTLDGLPMDVRSKWLDVLSVTAEWPRTKNAADLRFEVEYLTVRATARQRAIAFLLV